MRRSEIDAVGPHIATSNGNGMQPSQHEDNTLGNLFRLLRTAIRKCFGHLAQQLGRLAGTRNPSMQCRVRNFSGEPYRIRTCDPLIKSQLLYQLS